MLDGCPALASTSTERFLTSPRRAFADLDPFLEFTFINRVTAKLAIAAALAAPLVRLTDDERAFVDAVLAETLERRAVMARVMARLRPGSREAAARC